MQTSAAEKIFVKGNEAVAMAAIEAGCRCYFGYPITPQSDIPEYLSRELPRLGGEFLQAESEIGAINMLLGASATGVRAMTSSSGPGISLKQEGISYMAGSELPGVIVDIMRAGPGLGGIDASQADYFQATRGGGHGGYRIIVLAPASVQEMYDLTMLAFDLSDIYRMPAMVLADSVIGQMKESVTPNPRPQAVLPRRNGWYAAGLRGLLKTSSNPSTWVMARWRPSTGRCRPATRNWLIKECRWEEVQTLRCRTDRDRFRFDLQDRQDRRCHGPRCRHEGRSDAADYPVSFSRKSLCGAFRAVQTLSGYRAFHRPDDR